MNETIEKKAYALGIIGRELMIDFDDNLTTDQMRQIEEIAEDALLDEPKTETGKKFKIVIEEEKKNADSEYNQGFNFSKDLNNNKITPLSVFILQTFGKYAERIAAKDKEVDQEMLSEIIVKMNELGFPTDYIKTPFNVILGKTQLINDLLGGQLMARKEELMAYTVGVRHPKYKNLTPHIATFKQLDDAIGNAKEKFGFTEEDYRSTK